MDELVVFSADGHAGAPVEAYRPYLDPEYRELLDGLVEENARYLAVAGDPSRPTPEALDVFDRRGAHRAGGEYGCWDIDVRLRELDADGIAGELVHPGHQNATLPFFSIVNSPVPPDARAAGRRAYHRWAAEFMGAADGRLVGVAEAGPCLDMDEAVRELRWVAEHGFVSVSLPGTTADADLPPLYDEYFEPFFATCEEAGLVVSVHAGFGLPQGVFFDFHTRLQEVMAGSAAEGRDPDEALAILAEAMSNAQDSPLQLDLTVASTLVAAHGRGRVRPPSQPQARAHRGPGRLAAGHARASSTGGGRRRPTTQLTPSEYYRRNVVVAPSSIHRAEVELRYEIGIDQLLFGSDYPHPEGTWPNTRDWIRTALAGVPEDEARKILAGNAVAAYGLDSDRLGRRRGEDRAASLDPRRRRSRRRTGRSLRPASRVSAARLRRSTPPRSARCSTTTSAC